MMQSDYNQLSNAIVHMALAATAYAPPADIQRYINAYAPTSNWNAEWIPDDQAVPINFAFIASCGDQAVVAIRGTYPVPWNDAYWDDASQSNPFSPFVAWPYATNGALVTQSLLDGFSNVITLAGAGQTLSDAVLALPAETQVTVVGHSLGGSLAPLVAHWLSTKRAGVAVATFAGMTPGDEAFAALFGSNALPALRWWNTLDTVAYGWNQVDATADFYQPAPQGGVFVQFAIAYLAQQLAGKGFAPVGDSHPLEGAVAQPGLGYLVQNLYQHLPSTYIALLGGPALPFSITVEPVVTEADTSTTPAQVNGALVRPLRSQTASPTVR